MGYLIGGNASGVTHGGGLLLPTTHLSQTGRSCRSGKDLCEYAKRHQAKLITSADAGTSYRPDLPPARPLNTSTSPVNKHTADQKDTRRNTKEETETESKRKE